MTTYHNGVTLDALPRDVQRERVAIIRTGFGLAGIDTYKPVPGGATTVALHPSDSWPHAILETADPPLAFALEEIYGHGFADDVAGRTEFGLHGARVGPFILLTDDRGFMDVAAFPSDAEAETALAELEPTEEETT